MIGGRHHGLDVRDFIFQSWKSPFEKNLTSAMFVAVFNSKNRSGLYVQTSARTQKSRLFQFLYPILFLFLLSLKHHVLYTRAAPWNCSNHVLALLPPHRLTLGAATSAVPNLPIGAYLPRSIPRPALAPLPTTCLAHLPLWGKGTPSRSFKLPLWHQ